MNIKQQNVIFWGTNLNGIFEKNEGTAQYGTSFKCCVEMIVYKCFVCVFSCYLYLDAMGVSNNMCNVCSRVYMCAVYLNVN